MQENEYDDDFDGAEGEKFESFLVSGVDSMLILGEPVDDQIKLNNSKSFSLDATTTSDNFKSKVFSENNIESYDSNNYYDESFEDGGYSPTNANINEFSSLTLANKNKKSTKLSKKKKVDQNESTKQKDRELDLHGFEKPSDDAHYNSYHPNDQFASNSAPIPKKQPSEKSKFKRIAVNKSALHGGESVITSKVNNVSAIGSVVASDTKHDYFALQKQLNSALRRVAAYKQSNEQLQSKLDAAGIEASLERYKYLIIERDAKIMALADENSSLRQIARFQSKGLVRGAQERSSQPERELSQDRQIEILVEHVRKVKAKLVDSRAREDALSEENALLRAQTAKQSRRISKFKRVTEDLRADAEAARMAAAHDKAVAMAFKSSLAEHNKSIVLVGSAERTGIEEGEEADYALDPLLAEYPSIALSEVLPSDQQQQQPHQQSRHSEEGADLQEDSACASDLDDFSHQAPYDGPLRVNPGLDHHVESSSTFTVDTAANANQQKRTGRRRQDGERLKRAQLQLEEERLYVLRQKEVILRLEKSLHKQRAGFLSEVAAVRAELGASDEERRRLVGELDRREAVVKAQTLTLKQLRVSYEALMEGNRRLLETKDSLLRVNGNVTSPRVIVPPIRREAAPPPEPRPPSTSKPSSSSGMPPRGHLSTSKAPVLSTEDGEEEQGEGGAGGNMTFMTSEMIE